MSRRVFSAVALLFMSLVFAVWQDFFVHIYQSKQEEKISPVSSEIGVVQNVIDGDTIELDDGRVVRYIGIDTPEKNSPRVSNQCFSSEATERNKQLVLGKQIKLEKDSNETDKYGRLLRYVWVENTMVNEQLVKEGMAFARAYPPDVARQDQLSAAEQVAQVSRVGLWAHCQLRLGSAGQYYIDDQVPTAVSPTPAGLVAGDSTSQNECLIKGNISENGKLYHLPGCPSYNKVVISQQQGEQWFCNEEQASAAGWIRSRDCQ